MVVKIIIPGVIKNRR